MRNREDEPVIIHTPKAAVDKARHDGGLAPAIGVHNYQVFRANRTDPQDKNYRCYTLNHQPMLVYCHNRFYLQYLAGLHNEHEERTETFLTTSDDGINWSVPTVIFPAIEYTLFRYTIAHQRVGFYTAPNGRLLTLSFYGIPRDTDPTRLPNSGKGVGRAVREIYPDGSFGPIFFFRLMPKAGYTEDNTSHWYPHYRKSSDEGFVEACDCLYKDKLYHQQMWEEDRNNDDGFYGIHWEETEYATGKALSYWTNPDESVTGIWKGARASVTDKLSQTWSEPVSLPSIHKNNAKYWGQRTADGRYALMYSAFEDQIRTPLVVTTGNDGQNFGDMLLVHGDVPPQRFWGFSKDPGPQYVRGIVEGNGTSPGPYVWVTYSMNKEDIWVSRIPVPIAGDTGTQVSDDFSRGDPRSLEKWNIYSGKWNRVFLGEFKGRICLRLEDEDPYDYARAVRIFPKSEKTVIKFSMYAESANDGRLEVDVMDHNGSRPVKLAVQHHVLSSVMAGEDGYSKRDVFESGQWHDVEIHIDSTKQCYEVLMNGNTVLSTGKFAEHASSVERIEFRTGPYRMADQRTFNQYREIPQDNPDLPGSDHPVPMSAFMIGYVKTGL